MDCWIKLPYRKQQIQVTDDVVDLCHHRVLAVDHGKRRGALLTEVQDCLRFEAPHEAPHEWVIADVADEDGNLFPCQFMPAVHPVTNWGDRCQGVDAEGLIPVPPDEAVDNANFIATFGQVQGRSPPAVSISPDDQNLHLSSFAA